MAGKGGIARAYLVLYNTAQSLGYAACLAQIILALKESKGDFSAVYSKAGELTKIFQYVALLETIHAVLGLVPSNPVMALTQWAGKSNVLYLVVDKLPAIQSSPVTGSMLLVWTLSEVIRYPWYALSGLNACPKWLTWLRYTAFIPLYPVGVFGEMWCLYKALPTLKAERWYSFDLPNKYNFGFDYALFTQIMLFLYLPMWWQLYSTLLRTRRKKLAPQQGTAKDKTA